MDPDRQPVSPATGILVGMLAIGLRLGATFAVIFAGYYVYEWFGGNWFRVFVFATLAVCLHFEIRRIERDFPADETRDRS